MLLVFDMDGTILDSMPTLTQIATETISKVYQVSEADAKMFYLRTTGKPFVDQITTLFPTHKNNQLAIQTYEARHAQVCASMKVADGFPELLCRLKDVGHKTALVTSTDEEVLHMNLPQIHRLPFDFFGGNTLISPKRRQIQRAQLCFPNELHSVLFGDTLFDKLCAQETGCEFVMVTTQNVVTRVTDFLEGNHD